MKKVLILPMLIGVLVTSLFANVEEDILESTNSFKRFIETNKIPKTIIKDAQAIVVIPNYMKASFFIGGQYGNGLVIIKQEEGKWSNPFFVKVTGGSLGIQFGFESSDTIFIFRTQKSLKELLNNKITLGTEVSASVGPIKENYNIYKEANFKTDILTYHIKEGLFVGASFDGAVISHDKDKNLQLYGTSNVSTILSTQKRDDIYGIRELDKSINKIQ